MTPVVIGLVVILFLLFNWWGNKPAIHRGITYAELPRYFEALLQRGVIGGQVFVRVKSGEPAVLPFVKYATTTASGIRLVLSRNAGSEPFIEAVTATLAAGGFLVRMGEPRKVRQGRLAVVDLGRNVAEAVRLVEMVGRSHAGGEDTVDVWFKGLKTVPLREILKSRQHIT